jgi:hypothetical protein
VDDVHNGQREPSPSAPQRLRGAAALKLHVTLVVGLTLCSLAFWFELGRAEGGNELSWAYVFEWPLLSVFAVYMWWKFLHPGAEGVRRVKKDKPAIAPEYEGMLAGWEEHQRALAADQARNSLTSPTRPPSAPPGPEVEP